MPVTLDTLRALPLFSDLSPEESAMLARNSRIISCKRGNFLFRQGDRVTFFYVMCRGAMQIYRETPSGSEVTDDILISGDCLNAGEVAGTQAVHPANARAVEDCSILEIPVSWMREHLTDFDAVAKKLMASLADRLNTAQVEAGQAATMSAPQIVACYLKKLCVLYNFDPNGFELPYTKSLIASRLRIEKETFSRTLPTLRDHGITVSGAHVSIRDLRKADNFACSECSEAGECVTQRLLSEKLEKRTGTGA